MFQKYDNVIGPFVGNGISKPITTTASSPSTGTMSPLRSTSATTPRRYRAPLPQELTTPAKLQPIPRAHAPPSTTPGGGTAAVFSTSEDTAGGVRPATVGINGGLGAVYLVTTGIAGSLMVCL